MHMTGRVLCDSGWVAHLFLYRLLQLAGLSNCKKTAIAAKITVMGKHLIQGREAIPVLTLCHGIETTEHHTEV